jgi:hypothetical protein
MKAASQVLLGYEVGSGKPVELPVRNMVVTGQTQESGKTTTLEALVARSGVTALTFITKPGERSFAAGRRIQPYFRDRADWQFVDQLLAAQLGEKNKFLRSWIIKICRTTKTLADVQRAVRKALEKATGFNEGIYTQLDAYLELIVPEIEDADLADKLDLAPGLNVMDVTEFRTPMQMLFVQSALDWVNERCRDTVVVIPEAWEFIPQSKGSPVKASAEKLVRRGSGIGNRIWVDSQDTAGIDNLILRGCPVWLIGVQRQIDEIKRNLSNIPAGLAKPRPADIALLELGQYFACFGQTTVKVYVRPAWMDADEAIAVAKGATISSSAPAPIEPPTPKPRPKEDEVDKATAAALREEIVRLKDDVIAAEQRGFERGTESALRQAGEYWNAAALDVRDHAKRVTDLTEHLAQVAREGRWSVPRGAAKPNVREAASHAAPVASSSEPAPPAEPRPAPGKGEPTCAREGRTDLRLVGPLARSFPQALDMRLWALTVGVAEGTTKSGPWHRKVRALTDAGYLEKIGNKVRATEAGIKAGNIEPDRPEDEVALWALWADAIAGDVGDAAMGLLRLLALHRRFRLTNEQLALLAGKSPGTAKSGPWFTLIKALREWDLIEGDRSYAITEKGRAIVPGGQEPPLENTATLLQRARYERLENSQRHYDALTEPMTKTELGEKLGISAGTMKSGPWHGAIKEMVESKLVIDRSGVLERASEDLEPAR